MAKKASDKVSVKIGNTKYTFRFSVLSVEDWTVEQLQQVARNGFMGRVRAYVKSQVSDIDLKSKAWTAMLERANSVPKAKRPADFDGAMAMMRALHFGETPEVMPESFLALTPDELLGVEDEEEENGDETEG
jgi:hypothetical protein